MDVEADLVDDSAFEQGSAERAAAEDDHVLAGLVLQIPYECDPVSSDERHARLRALREGAGEEIGAHPTRTRLLLGVLRAVHPSRDLVGLAADQDRVDVLP